MTTAQVREVAVATAQARDVAEATAQRELLRVVIAGGLKVPGVAATGAQRELPVL